MKQKDEYIFKNLFDTFYTPLCNYASSIISNDQIAEDIIQNLFVQLWENKKFKNLEKPENFLLRSTRFKCIDYLRTAKKNLLVVDDKLPQNIPTSQQMDFKEEDIMPLLHFLAASLPPKTREVFLLSREEGLSHKEIAEKLHTSVKTVANQITNALKIIRELLQKLGYFIFLIIFLLSQ